VAQKQINGRVPDFMWEEWNGLRLQLREIGCKPTDGDLVAALVHAARRSAEETKGLVEDYIKHELAVERERSGEHG
jgi:hypothetical protein